MSAGALTRKRLICYTLAMKLSILIPAYNERKTLPLVLDKLKPVKMDKEVVLVDDGSTDGTAGWVRGAVKSGAYPYEIKFFRHEKNVGKGGSLATAIENAEGEICVVQDADLEYDPKYIEKLIEPIAKGECDVVYGSRVLSGESETYSLLYLWGNKFLSFLNGLFFGLKMTDSYTGYKAFRTDFLKGLEISSSGFEVEAEISAKISLKKCKFAEIPIVYCSRSRKDGKKINYRDALKGVLKILEIRLRGSIK